jgi:hypothetical protein
MPHSSIKQKIPFEVFNDEELTSLAHLRVLGAPCYRVIPAKDKMASRSAAGILVGYISDGRGKTGLYRI